MAVRMGEAAGADGHTYIGARERPLIGYRPSGGLCRSGGHAHGFAAACRPRSVGLYMHTQSRGHGTWRNSPIKVMRTLSISLLFTAASLAQSDPKPAVAVDKVLDETLTAWEKRMSKLEGLSATVKVTEI